MDEDKVTELIRLVESAVAESAADLRMDEDEVYHDVAESVLADFSSYADEYTREERAEAGRVLGVTGWLGLL